MSDKADEGTINLEADCLDELGREMTPHTEPESLDSEIRVDDPQPHRHCDAAHRELRTDCFSAEWL